MSFTQTMGTYLKKYEQSVLLIAALSVSVADRVVILLHISKNMHKMPIPSLRTVEFIFDIITLFLLLFFYFRCTGINQQELVFFVITLLNGVVILLSIFPLYNILSPLISTAVVTLNILLFLYLGLIIAARYKNGFPNVKIVILLAALGFFCVFMSDFFEKATIKDLIFYSLLAGNLFTLGSAILFSTTAILIPYLKNRITTLKFILLLSIPLITSLVLLMGISDRQLLVQIITTSLKQTLNLTVFREIPGISLTTQKLFLLLCLSTILLTVSAIITLLSNYNEKQHVVWVLIIAVLGLEIATPFINVLRLLAIYMLSKEGFTVELLHKNKSEEESLKN